MNHVLHPVSWTLKWTELLEKGFLEAWWAPTRCAPERQGQPGRTIARTNTIMFRFISISHTRPSSVRVRTGPLILSSGLPCRKYAAGWMCPGSGPCGSGRVSSDPPGPRKHLTHKEEIYKISVLWSARVGCVKAGNHLSKRREDNESRCHRREGEVVDR